jgi:tetratricopeptide (TPR) repeat protein
MKSLTWKIGFLFVLVIGALLLSLRTHGFVKDPIYDDLEGVALIQALLKDAKWDLAHEEIAQLEKHDAVSGRYYRGQWYYLKGAPEKALAAFESLKNQNFTDLDIWRMRSYAQLKKDEKCLSAVPQFFNRNDVTESDYLMRAQCAQRLKKNEKAWQTLQQARKRFASYTVETEWLALQLQLGLNHQAWQTAQVWLVQKMAPAPHFLQLAELFQAKGLSELALKVLELGRLRHPTNMDINLAFSQVYFHKGFLFVAEEGFARAALKDSKYHYHVAELNRQTGRYERSLYFNSHVVEEKERLKQKIATYVDANRYALIASMDSVIQTSELAKDEEILYALSYSLVRNGDREKPLKYLAKITKPDLVEKSTLLRQALLECQKKQDRCDI